MSNVLAPSDPIEQRLAEAIAKDAPHLASALEAQRAAMVAAAPFFERKILDLVITDLVGKVGELLTHAALSWWRENRAQSLEQIAAHYLNMPKDPK